MLDSPGRIGSTVGRKPISDVGLGDGRGDDSTGIVDTRSRGGRIPSWVWLKISRNENTGCSHGHWLPWLVRDGWRRGDQGGRIIVEVHGWSDWCLDEKVDVEKVGAVFAERQIV